MQEKNIPVGNNSLIRDLKICVPSVEPCKLLLMVSLTLSGPKQQWISEVIVHRVRTVSGHDP